MSWRKGDRCLHKPSGQRGVMEDIRFDTEGEGLDAVTTPMLLIYWGVMNGQRAESWVPEEECIWELAPPVKSS